MEDGLAQAVHPVNGQADRAREYAAARLLSRASLEGDADVTEAFLPAAA